MSSAQESPATVNLDAEIGRRVHQLMWDRQITQTAFGQRVGMDQSSVAKRLRGKLGWSAQQLAATASVLGTTVGYLFGEDGGDTPAPLGSGTNVRTTDYKAAVSSLDAYRAKRSA